MVRLGLPRHLGLSAAIVLILVAAPIGARAALYSPGATLNPACKPTDANCGVATSTIASGTTGQIPYYAANGRALTATSTFTILSNGHVGFGTTTPWARFSIAGVAGGTVPLFAISTSTSAHATSTAFIVDANGHVGIATTSPGYALTVNGTIDGSVQDTGGQVYNAKAYGMKCNDTTDDTAAFNSLLQKVYDNGGGTIFIKGTCLISGQLTIPHSADSVPTQPMIRITGAGSSANGRWTSLPASPSALDLRYNDTVAKIDTRGAGTLEIDHITLEDKGTDCSPFIQTTNTTLKIHDVAFSGTASGNSACNDAIVLGGTTTNINGTATAAFQGYGTVIQNNFFDKIRRMVYGGVYANGVTIRDNTYSAESGNGLSGGAAIDFDNHGLGSVSGNVISGNLLELVHGTYGITFPEGGYNNYLSGNGCWDPGSSYVSCVYFGSTSSWNSVIPGESSSDRYVTDESGNNTIINTSGDYPTVFSSAQNTTFRGPVYSNVKFQNQDPNSLNGFWFTRATGGAKLDFQAGGNIATSTRTGGVVTVTTTYSHNLLAGQAVTIADSSDSSFNGTFTIATVDSPNDKTFTYDQSGADATSTGGTVLGPAESLMTINRNRNTAGYNYLYLNGSTQNVIAGASGSGNFRLETGSGGVLWLGDRSAQNVYVYNKGLYFNAGGQAASTGRINLASTDSIKFRNNAGTNDVNGLSKNSSDQVVVGDTSGVTMPGNLSVGTTSAYARLTVWGKDSGATTTAFSVVNNASTTAFAVFDNGNATYSGSIFQSSDRRLKTDVTPLDASSSLAAIEELRPVSYLRRDQPSGGTNLGFIAQDVQQIFPELVSTTSPTSLTPGGTLTLNYVGLISPIVRAVQDLASKLDSVAATVAGFAKSFTSQQVYTHELCLTDNSGSTCYSRSQLAALLQSRSAANDNSATASNAQQCSLSATPDTVAVGGHVVLVWSAPDTGTFSINQGVGDVSPAISGTTTSKAIDADTTFVGTATSPKGDIGTCSVRVSVTQSDQGAGPSNSQTKTGSLTAPAAGSSASSTPANDNATSTSPSDSTASSRSPASTATTTPVGSTSASSTPPQPVASTTVSSNGGSSADKPVVATSTPVTKAATSTASSTAS